MFRKIICGKEYIISALGRDLFASDDVRGPNSFISLDIMHNCIDTIYYRTFARYPRVTKPNLYLYKSNDNNAFAYAGDIYVSTGLLFNTNELIKQRYSRETLERYNLLNGQTVEEIQSKIRVNSQRFIVLHELYHIWHGHSLWLQKYYCDENGEVHERYIDRECILQEMTFANGNFAPRLNFNLTMQAIELDADNCAVATLIGLMMEDVKSKKHIGINLTVERELALIMASISTIFCLFDNNSGAKFELLQNDLRYVDHPIPSIRFLNAELTANSVLYNYYKDEEVASVEVEWNKFVCDVDADYQGQIDMGQVFWYTAYTRKALSHFANVENRFYDIYDSLLPFVLSDIFPKDERTDVKDLEGYVLFTDTGVSTKGWINPATGKPTAKRKPQTIVKKKKIGVNDPCPCGSGKKYKKCKCKEYHS